MDKTKRNLDGMWFRIKRDGKNQNICFSDMTIEEQLRVLKDKDVEFMRRMSLTLAEKMREIGDKYDITME